MTKTVTIDVPIEVRKTGPDAYQHRSPGGDWSASFPESEWRSAPNYFGARAIIQAIDSGAFADPLPTAVGVSIYNPELKIHFMRTGRSVINHWVSTEGVRGEYFHTDEMVLSYGPFEVLYDPEAQS